MLFALAYNLGNFLGGLAVPKKIMEMTNLNCTKEVNMGLFSGVLIWAILGLVTVLIYIRHPFANEHGLMAIGVVQVAIAVAVGNVVERYFKNREAKWAASRLWVVLAIIIVVIMGCILTLFFGDFK